MLPKADMSRPPVTPKYNAGGSQTKADPFSTKLHRRIDVVLLLATVVIIALVVRASAHGQTATAMTSDLRLLTSDFCPASK